MAVEWLNDIVVSDAIASKKKAFIHGSPLVRRKKGLGEGKSPRADMSGAASHRRRLAQIVVNCDAGNTRMCFANQTPPAGEKRTNLILIDRSFFLTEETAGILSKRLTNCLRRGKRREANEAHWRSQSTVSIDKGFLLASIDSFLIDRNFIPLFLVTFARKTRESVQGQSPSVLSVRDIFN